VNVPPRSMANRNFPVDISAPCYAKPQNMNIFTS